MYDPLQQVLQQSGVNLPSIQAMQSAFAPKDYSRYFQQPQVISTPGYSQGSFQQQYQQPAQQTTQAVGGSSPMQDASGLSQDDYFKRLRQIESQGDPTAYNSSGHAGLYQFSKSTADPYLRKLGTSWEAFRKDPQLQDRVAKMWTNDLDATLGRNGLPVTNRNRWFLHNLGPGGGVNLLKGRYDKINPTHITSNLPAKYGTTAQDYINYWSRRWA